MKKILVLAFAIAACLPVSAQQKAPTKKPRPDPAASHKELRVVARNIAAEVRAPLTDAEHAVALRVEVGSLPCELGQVVELEPDTAARGFFHLRLGKTRYHVAPEETTTGAIRLEDKAAGIVWLQLANKSMLMNQKLGKRLADECKSPAQILVAQAMVLNPPPSVLDAPPEPATAPALPASAPQLDPTEIPVPKE